MDKQHLLNAIIAHFEGEYTTLAGAARATYEAATHEENRAENKYDTRGLEASYLAESQARRANELRQTVNIYRALEMRSFGEDDAIAMTALVEVDDGQQSKWYFIGPRGGGTAINVDGKSVTILSGASPMGRSLLGNYISDEVETGPVQSRKTLEIVSLF